MKLGESLAETFLQTEDGRKDCSVDVTPSRSRDWSDRRTDKSSLTTSVTSRLGIHGFEKGILQAVGLKGAYRSLPNLTHYRCLLTGALSSVERWCLGVCCSMQCKLQAASQNVGFFHSGLSSGRRGGKYQKAYCLCGEKNPVPHADGVFSVLRTDY